MFQRSLLAILVLCLACSGSFGCASKYGEQTTKVVLFPDCYEPIQTLRNEEHRVAKTTASAAVGGGLLGALLGGLTGGTRGAVAGAVVGAAAGGAGGYFYAVNKQSKNTNARMARYMQDLNGDISDLTIVTASARMAIQCYQQKFETRLALYKENAISREQLEASYTEIRSGVDEAQRILGRVVISAQEGDARYKAAIDEEEKRRPRNLADEPRRDEIQSYKQPQKTPKSGSLGEVKAKQASYQTSIANAQKTQKEAEDFNARMLENMS